MNVTLLIMEGGRVDDHVIRSAVRLVHPMVLRNVFSMAVDEMDKVYDLDSKVCFFFKCLCLVFKISKILFFLGLVALSWKMMTCTNIRYNNRVNAIYL